ncbi:unnamed protein product [Leptidea sinapis]|uniref:Uncharacterized protein n=1 Tax=Leptidea sinapis TaxID=189913 RepID=A0A5E4Q8I6_9NEOP|nr:unnamed protein product [Leptidea sinapis]
MKRGKTKSNVSLAKSTSELQASKVPELIEELPLDVLKITILNLRTPDEPSKKYFIKAAFFDELIISSIVTSVGHRDLASEEILAEGKMNYDPSDSEKISLFADHSLTVTIQPTDNIKDYILYDEIDTRSSKTHSGDSQNPAMVEIYCCNIDILPIFIDKERLQFKQRMQPIQERSALNAKSWCNLPIIDIEVTVNRNPENDKLHKLLQIANFMNFTLIGGFNMVVPLRETDDVFTMSDEKFTMELDDFYNEDNLDLNYYVRSPMKES